MSLSLITNAVGDAAKNQVGMNLLLLFYHLYQPNLQLRPSSLSQKHPLTFPCRSFTTSTNPICNCGHQVSFSETPSRFPLPFFYHLYQPKLQLQPSSPSLNPSLRNMLSLSQVKNQQPLTTLLSPSRLISTTPCNPQVCY